MMGHADKTSKKNKKQTNYTAERWCPNSPLRENPETNLPLRVSPETKMIHQTKQTQSLRNNNYSAMTQT
jgi:hypothetical protein